eukprot:870768-Rhodomonas_salina.2
MIGSITPSPLSLLHPSSLLSPPSTSSLSFLLLPLPLLPSSSCLLSPPSLDPPPLPSFLLSPLLPPERRRELVLRVGVGGRLRVLRKAILKTTAPPAMPLPRTPGQSSRSDSEA